jgi:hypothetical protein
VSAPPPDADWLASLEGRAGPLLSVARRFLSDHPGAPDRRLPSGAPGVAALADAIDAWAERESVDDSDDEAFVEGAGALLAMLLLSHFPISAHAARAGAHRVRIGDGGFFDPFTAIESALEGPSARGVLATEIAGAEAEASGQRGIGRAVRLFKATLAAQRSELGVSEHFAEHLVLTDRTEIDLSRVLAATEGEDDATARRAVEMLVAMLPGGAREAGPSWEEARAVLLPRLVAPDFADRVSGGTLAVRTVLGGAAGCAMILGYESRSRYVRTDELARWNVDAESALRAAIQNLAERSQRARFARVDTEHGPLCVARTGDALDGARLLLPTLHAVLAPELGSPFLAAAPHRDALWACAAEPASLRAALVKRVRDDAARAPHRISDALFLVTASGVRRAE